MKKLGWVERRDKMEKVVPEMIEALKAMQKACDEWAAEFTQKTRAMNWGVVNDAYIKAFRAIAAAEAIAYKPDPETALRASWDKQGVPKERQDELIREVEEKAKPGAKIGPFTIGE